MTSTYIIVSYFAYAIIAMYIIAIACCVSAYSDYKYYKLAQKQQEKAYIDKRLADYMDYLDSEEQKSILE